MKKKYFILSLLAVSIFSSCQNQTSEKPLTTESIVDSTSVSTQVTDTLQSIQIDPQVNIAETGAPYTIDSLTINGDILSVFVNYSGGCKEHQFNLYSNGNVAKSMPVQMVLCLKHTNNDDNCRKQVIQELKFNIAPIKNDNHETIVLNIGNKTIQYSLK